MTVVNQRALQEGPSVSVVIPAYNVAGYLDKSVGSALAQGVDVEVIVVDDGSTDATPDAIRRLEADPRVRGFRLSVNGGPSAARNKGLDEARGEWVAFLDADDWFAPGRLAYLLDVAGAAGADAVSDDLALISDGADKPWTTFYELSGWAQSEDGILLSPTELCRRDWILQPMFRTAWLRERDLRFHPVRHSAGEDFEFYMNAMLCGVKWVTARRAMYFYRSRPGQLTADRALTGGLIESAEAMSRDPRIQGDAELARAFADRLERVRAAHWVGRLVQAIRERRWLGAAAMLVRSPGRIADAAAALRRRRKVDRLRRRKPAVPA
ncbi:MAG TPA: glycosyltransferase family 2 protein [Allosphingosinicella sp.]